MNKKKQIKLYILLFVIFFLCIGIFLICFWQDTNLKVVFFDIGQGDSIFIKTPYGQKILIDGGPNEKIITKLSNKIPFYDKKIDIIILTHPHADHVTGLIEVLKRYKVENVLYNGAQHTTNEYLLFLDLLEKQKINKILLTSPMIFDLGQNLKLKILYPFEDISNEKHTNLNNTSIVSKLVYKNVSFLFAADIEKEIEDILSQTNIDISSDILKIPHQGSKTSSTLTFLKKVNPKIGVLTVGKNNFFGHPHKIVLNRLKKFNIKLLRTDINGDIIFSSNGTNFNFSTSKIAY